MTKKKDEAKVKLLKMAELDGDSGSESVSESTDSEMQHPFRKEAPVRRGYTRGAATGLDDGAGDAAAVRNLKKRVYAKTSEKSRKVWNRVSPSWDQTRRSRVGAQSAFAKGQGCSRASCASEGLSIIASFTAF